jgi:DhnA family fructose-bisphosphate aldolase class Ia
MNDVTLETLLNDIPAILEEHNNVLLSHRTALDHVLREIAKLKEVLTKLKSNDSLDSTDANFITYMTARLESISQTNKEKGLY